MDILAQLFQRQSMNGFSTNETGQSSSAVYLMAHTHSPAAFRNCFYRADPRNNNITKTEHLFVNTAAWLRYGGYGDKQGYKPASNINPVIYLDGRTKEARALI